MDIGLDLQTAYREGYEQGKFDAFMELTHGGKIDFMPVVRCIDCKFYKQGEFKGYAGGLCNRHRLHISDVDYCSYGERREENE